MNGGLVSLYCRFQIAEFAIRYSEIVESLGTTGIQTSGFAVLPDGVSEPALRGERNTGFMVFSGSATGPDSFTHDGGDFIAFASNVENRRLRSEPAQ
jgi:hypothetical protein